MVAPGGGLGQSVLHLVLSEKLPQGVIRNVSLGVFLLWFMKERVGLFFLPLALKGRRNQAQVSVPALSLTWCRSVSIHVPSLSFSCVKWEYYRFQRVLKKLKCGHIRKQYGTAVKNTDSRTALRGVEPSLRDLGQVVNLSVL